MRLICGSGTPMAEIVYLLCFVASTTVAVLLLRGYLQNRQRLLLWCSLGFIGLCLNNLLLVTDRVILTDQDLSIYRIIPAAVGVGLMVFGLLWDSNR